MKFLEKILKKILKILFQESIIQKSNLQTFSIEIQFTKYFL